MPSTVIERPKVMTLGAAADKLWQLREDKRALDKQVAAIEAEIKDLTEVTFGLLEAQDTRKGEGKKAAISVNHTVVANTTNWNDFMAFVVAGKRGDKLAYTHLVQHRVSDPAYRELRARGLVIPGLEDFTKRSLSITTLTS
jgi:hypothetical protein